MNKLDISFVVDVMLGRLARWLRLLGYSVYYDRFGEDSALLARAISGKSILLTRDHQLADRASQSGFLLESDDFREQLATVIKKFNLELKLFGDICPLCGGRIAQVPKETVEGEVPEYTYATHEVFKKCQACENIYWSGSHRELAIEQLKEIFMPFQEGNNEIKGNS
ncbi:Mut7-C RNAse domain-containing protein [bacterium]|nr:Mut7-C RNAse domain-containing protein [bacterium]